MTLEESLAKLKLKIEGAMPSEHIKIMHDATATLEASGIERTILKVGDKAPEFILENQDGILVASKTLITEGPLVITFYRGLWCPYCNVDLGNLKRYNKEIKELGAHMISISPQLSGFNKQITDRQRLNFDLLSDSGNKVASKFGLRWTMVNPLKSLYQNNFKIKLPDYNGDDSWSLPIPARFIIGVDGLVKYAEYSIDYTKRPNPDILIETLKLI